MTINISHPDSITKMTQSFNGEVKALMNFNIPATPHKGAVQKQVA